MGSRELLLKDMDFTTVDNANQAVDTIEDAIEAVADVRASFGASLNHLEHTGSNLGVTKEPDPGHRHGGADYSLYHGEYHTPVLQFHDGPCQQPAGSGDSAAPGINQAAGINQDLQQEVLKEKS